MRLSLLLLCALAITLPAFGSETETLFSGANPEPWNFMREAPRLNAEFNHCTMKPGESGADHVMWRFNTKDMRYADIVRAIANLERSTPRVSGGFWILNLYRW